jgi:ABC-2 type transport system permease protein
MKDINKPQDEEIRNDNNNVNDLEEIKEDTIIEENISVESVQEDGVDSVEDIQNQEADSESADKEEPEDGEESSDSKDSKKKKIRRDLRRLRYGGMATAMTAVVIAVVVLINVIAGILNDRFPFNIDLTAEKLFSLSEDSKNLAKNITKDTEIIVFAEEAYFSSPNTQEEAINKVFKQFYETTKQYQNLSGGKIKTSYVDLAVSPALATKYNEYNVNNGDILFRCGDRWQKSNVDQLFSYDEQSYYYYNSMTNVSSLVENVVSSNIAMVTSDKTPLVTILTGHSEDGNLISAIESVIRNNNYKTESLDITGSAKFNEESVIALIAAPQTDYSDNEIEKLRTWLKNDSKYNRHLAVFIDYKADCPNLYEFLNVEYGLEVSDNLVFETDPNRMFSYYPHYVFGDIQSSDHTLEIVNTKALMPTVRQILTNKENDKEKTLYNVDLITFPETSKLVKLADALDQDNEEELKQIDADEYPVVGAAYATKWGYTTDNEKYESNVFLSGCTSAFTSEVMTLTSIENEALLLSVFNGFTGNESPITISSKSLEKTKLEFTTGQQNIFFMIFVVSIPIILLIICMMVFIRRRRL